MASLSVTFAILFSPHETIGAIPSLFYQYNRKLINFQVLSGQFYTLFIVFTKQFLSVFHTEVINCSRKTLRGSCRTRADGRAK